MDRQAQLLEVISALGPTSRFTCGLDRWQQERDQDGDDGNDYQQLDQGETASHSFHV
jgi:hypothetical protein